MAAEAGDLFAGLPAWAQFSANLAVFVVTAAVAVWGFVSKKADHALAESHAFHDIPVSHMRVIESLTRIAEVLSSQAEAFHRMAEVLGDMHREAEIEREVRRRMHDG